MIIKINFTPDLASDRNNKIRALENILVSFGECKHVVWMPIETAKQLTELEGFSSYAKRIAYALKSFVIESRGIEKNFSFHIVADFINGNRIELVNQTELHIGYLHFKDSHILQTTIFLTENLKDAEVFKLGAEVFLYNNRLLKAHKISLEKMQGGGNTTFDVYKDLVARESFFLCLIDSDLKHPRGPLGTTAQRFSSETKGLVGKRCLTVLACHEIENILPLAIVKSVCSNIESGLLYRLGRIDTHRIHPDHKEGLTIARARAMDETHNDNYWEEFYHLHVETQDVWLLPPLGQNLLSNSIRLMVSNSTQKLAEYINSDSDSIWCEISKLVASWGISMKSTVH